MAEYLVEYYDYIGRFQDVDVLQSSHLPLLKRRLRYKLRTNENLHSAKIYVNNKKYVGQVKARK